MSQQTSIVLLLSLSDSKEIQFTNGLEQKVLAVCNRDQVFTMDNFSDQLMLNYARDFINKSEKLLVICDEMNQPGFGSWMSVLNMAMKKHAGLISLGDSPQLKPYLKKMNGKVVEEEQLISTLKELL